MLAEGRRPRLRTAQAIRPKESQLHSAVAKELRKLRDLTGKFIFWHIPNGEHRDEITGAKLKRMGVLEGVPDFELLCSDGRSRFIELKREGGRLTFSQSEFQRKCKEWNVCYVVAYSMGDVVTALRSWGIL